MVWYCKNTMIKTTSGYNYIDNLKTEQNLLTIDTTYNPIINIITKPNDWWCLIPVDYFEKDEPFENIVLSNNFIIKYKNKLYTNINTNFKKIYSSKKGYKLHTLYDSFIKVNGISIYNIKFEKSKL